MIWYGKCVPFIATAMIFEWLNYMNVEFTSKSPGVMWKCTTQVTGKQTREKKMSSPETFHVKKYNV